MYSDSSVRTERFSNIAETRKRLERIFASLYLASLIVLFAWFDIFVNPTQLSAHIQALDRALVVDSLKPWDDYLYGVASCFPAFYFSDQGAIVDPDRLKEYISAFEKENDRLADMWSSRGLAGYRIDEMKRLLTSAEHWKDCEFWARQDTLVSYLFSTAYLLDCYYMARTEAVLNGRFDAFLNRYPELNRYVDSTLCQLRVDIDSVRTPFDYSVMVGWNPFLEGLSINMSMWGRQKSFDDYTSLDLADRAAILHRLQIIGRFGECFMRSKAILERVRETLKKTAASEKPFDSVSFSREKSNIAFVDLSRILASSIWNKSALPETLSVPRLLNLKLEVQNTYPRNQWAVFDSLFPDFALASKRYRIDKVGGLRQMRELLRSEELSVHRRVSAFGATVSYNALMIVMPAIIISLYLFGLFVLQHLNRILRQSVKDGVLGSDTSFREISNAPSLLFLRPRALSLLLISFPGLIAAAIYTDQLGILGPAIGGTTLVQVVGMDMILLGPMVTLLVMANRVISLLD